MPEQSLEAAPSNEVELEERLSSPTEGVVEALGRLEGDVLVLGVGGKMGPTLARMVRRAFDTLGTRRRVIGVARFTDAAVETQLQAAGVQTVRCDLLDRAAIQDLPDAPNVIYMAGQKFGTTQAPERTWAMNTLVPAVVAERFAGARTVVFSTGNVYPCTFVGRGGSVETDPPEPLGEYGNSCLGRERLYAYVAGLHRTPIVLFRLGYAIDLRYGVLFDVAQKVAGGEPIDLTVGHATVIWQGDANACAICCLEQAAYPPSILNVTGPELVSIRWLATRFGQEFGHEPVFVNQENGYAGLMNAAKAFHLYGYPRVTLEQMVRWQAQWIRQGGRSLNKPTHFETYDGKY